MPNINENDRLRRYRSEKSRDIENSIYVSDKVVYADVEDRGEGLELGYARFAVAAFPMRDSHF